MDDLGFGAAAGAFPSAADDAAAVEFGEDLTKQSGRRKKGAGKKPKVRTGAAAAAVTAAAARPPPGAAAALGVTPPPTVLSACRRLADGDSAAPPLCSIARRRTGRAAVSVHRPPPSWGPRHVLGRQGMTVTPADGVRLSPWPCTA